MKLHHTAVLALVLAFGVGCTRYPPLSSWHIVESPVRPCVGPRDLGLRYDPFNSRAQCFYLAASPDRWSRVSVSVGRWPFTHSDFDSEDECRARLMGPVIGGHRFEVLPQMSQFMCVRADDPRLAK